MKTIDKITNKGKAGLVGLGLLGLVSAGGCAGMNNPTANRNLNAWGQTAAHSFMGSLASEAAYKILNPEQPQYQPQQTEYYKERNQGPWAGTAIANRIVNPDGSIIFMLDANKIGEQIDTNYADKFLDVRRYNKTWERNGISGFIITYIPKQKDNEPSYKIPEPRYEKKNHSINKESKYKKVDSYTAPNGTRWTKRDDGVWETKTIYGEIITLNDEVIQRESKNLGRPIIKD